MRKLQHILGALAVILALSPLGAAAAVVTYPQDTTLVMTGNGITLTIRAGSQADNLIVNATTFTVTVAGGESFLLRYPGPTPGRFPNNGGLAECTYVGGNNDLTVSGPVTVTFTPSTTSCDPPAPGGGGGGGGISGGGGTPMPTIILYGPAAGVSVAAGSTQRASWSYSSTQVHSVRLRLTIGGVDAGVLTSGLSPSSGYGDWVVPQQATTQARLIAEALSSSGAILAADDSDAFTIASNDAPPTVPTPVPTPSSSYAPSTATAAATSISADKGLAVTPGACLAQSLIKLANDGDPTTQHDTAVYYCGTDGKRYVFPNERVYKTWYADYGGVTVVSTATLASIPIGGNVTYRPGVKMIKIQTDPKVYAIDRDGLLRWITTEAVAIRLYGQAWNTQVHDLSDAFFVDYTVGEPITQ